MSAGSRLAGPIRLALVIVGFAIITIALTWLWTEWGRRAYGHFLLVVAPPIYDLIGFGDARVGAFRQRYINFVPFVGLVLVTPRLSPRRRAIGLLAGLFALFVGHLALNLTERVYKGAHLPVVPSMISDALPLLLWIVVAYPVVSDWFAHALSAGSSTPETTAVAPEPSAETASAEPDSPPGETPR